jgi:hypothetical protein
MLGERRPHELIRGLDELIDNVPQPDAGLFDERGTKFVTVFGPPGRWGDVSGIQTHEERSGRRFAVDEYVSVVADALPHCVRHELG